MPGRYRRPLACCHPETPVTPRCETRTLQRCRTSPRRRIAKCFAPTLARTQLHQNLKLHRSHHALSARCDVAPSPDQSSEMPARQCRSLSESAKELFVFLKNLRYNLVKFFFGDVPHLPLCRSLACCVIRPCLRHATFFLFQKSDHLRPLLRRQFLDQLDDLGGIHGAASYPLTPPAQARSPPPRSPSPRASTNRHEPP
jgi:hypothetical protein